MVNRLKNSFAKWTNATIWSPSLLNTIDHPCEALDFFVGVGCVWGILQIMLVDSKEVARGK
jgi:hypothetical protein